MSVLPQLRHQAKDLRRAVLRGDAEALELVQTHHPGLDASAFELHRCTAAPTTCP